MTASGNPHGFVGITLAVLAVAVVSIPMWKVITSLLGKTSGWFALARRYAGRDPSPELVLRFRSGMMGMRVRFSGSLTFTASRAGLGMSVWRFLGGVYRPMLIPWREIVVTPDASRFGNYTRLAFGRPEIGHILIATWVWEKLLVFSFNGDGVFGPEAGVEP